MDRNHQLDAPNNESLKNIEQIEDRSGLATVYRKANTDFEGELMSESDREEAKAKKVADISGTIWKSAPKIGLCLTYPLISGSLIIVLLYLLIDPARVEMMIGPAILAIGVWLFTSYKAYAAMFSTFYTHAMQTGPFLMVMLATALLATQASYDVVTTYIGGQSLLFNVALVSLLVVIYTIIASYIVLTAWGSVTVRANIKVLIAGTVILVTAFLAIITYLL